MDDLINVAKKSRHVLTLVSGGLDSTYVLDALSSLDCEITALSVNVGEGKAYDDLRSITDHFGANLEVIDCQEEFTADAVLPAIRAQAKYMGIYPISSSLSRPILARTAVRLAKKLDCDVIIHTANQSENSLRRLNGAIQQLGFRGWYGTPYELSSISRKKKISELTAKGLERFYRREISGDANLWCHEFESGALDNPESFAVPKELFTWTAGSETHAACREITIGFQAGVPISLDGQSIPLKALIDRLNYDAGSFGIGRYCGLEHLEFGEKVLEVREAPAATLLMNAARHLETAVLDAEFLREKINLEQLWVREAIEGRWFGALREALDSFMLCVAKRVTGSVSYRLRPGIAEAYAIKADCPLYLTDRDAWEFTVAQQAGRQQIGTLIPVVERIVA
ncbi:argininosuccinate synthase-related protein [Salinisphaera sp. SWV1]|uniref:argininosuccinate synthase-related protein n=1 Tax=Salinisphaera sp. SWV1 TaxID=3454139 RepID=UPI003F849BC4